MCVCVRLLVSARAWSPLTPRPSRSLFFDLQVSLYSSSLVSRSHDHLHVFGVAFLLSLSLSLFISVSLCLYLFILLSLCLPACLFVCVCLSLPVYLSIPVSLYTPTASLFYELHFFVCLSLSVYSESSPPPLSLPLFSTMPRLY